MMLLKKLIAAILCLCITLGAASCASDYSSEMPSTRDTVTSQDTQTQQTNVPLQTTVSQQSEKWVPEHTLVTTAATPAETTTITTTSAATTTTTTTTSAAATKAKATTTKKKTTTAAPVTTTKPKPKVTTTRPAAPAPAVQKKVINYSDTSTKLFYITKNTNLYDLKKNHTGAVYAGSLYTGHYDANYKGYVVIDYLYGKSLVADVSVTERSGAKMLSAAAIGQMGGSIYGQASCGPTAAAILVNSQLGLGWSKDNMIKYCESKRLNDQGSLRYGGGITAPNLIKAINGFSGGKVTASNVFGADPASRLKKLIDQGNRSIVVVQYTSYIVTHYSSGTHFVVICGYEYIGGVLYFYYADPYYSYGGRSLLRVNASVLAASMNMVCIEPRCIITVKRTGT